MIATWKRCREKFALRYVDGLVPARAKRAPSFGSLFHSMMDALWRGGSPTQAMSLWRQDILDAATEHQKKVEEQLGIKDDGIVDSARDQADETMTECLALFTHYRDTVFKKEEQRYDPLFVESTFNVPLTTRDDRRHPVWRFKGKWDLVLYDNQSDKTVIRDYKTTVRKASEFAYQAELDTQPISYFYAALYLKLIGSGSKYDEPKWPLDFPQPDGFELEVIRKKVPKEPPPLKRGALSKAQNIDTTPELYRLAIQRNGLNEEDYSEILERLEKRGPVFHYRHRVSIGPEEIRRWAHETRIALEDIRRVELHRDLAYRADPMTCQNQYGRRCEYHAICFGDAEVAKTDFVVRQIHEELIDKTEGEDD